MAQPIFDVRRLIETLGGPAVVAAALGKPRTAPYRWMKTGRLSGDLIVELMAWFERDGIPVVLADYRL